MVPTSQRQRASSSLKLNHTEYPTAAGAFSEQPRHGRWTGATAGNKWPVTGNRILARQTPGT